jgi:fluoroacetyl-CoA thioesterase
MCRMSRPVPAGAHAEVEERVEFKHTLTAHHSQLPPVYSTPDMIRLMETACFHALLPYAEEGEINVGTAIHVEHRAATGIGSRVRARAELESFDGRFYIMRVSAWVVANPAQNSGSGAREIGRGTIHRAVIKVADFVSRIQNT